MRLGLVTTWAECGAGHVSLAYAHGLTAVGCDVEIYSRGNYLRDQRWEACKSRPWPLHLDPCAEGLTRVSPYYFDRWLKSFRPDWLVFNEQRSWGPVLQAKQAGIKCAAYVDYYKADTVELFKLYDLIICHTQRHYKVFKQHGHACYIPWGVDTSLFSPGPRLLSGLDDTEPLSIVHSAGMGGPSDRKGTDLALSAFNGVKGSARFLFHTQLPRSQWPSAWNQAISSDSRIEVIEGSIDPVSLYQQGDLYVYPSRLEGIGLTLPEALSTGLSAITTDAPPMSEFVTDGLTGSLVPVAEYRGRSDGYFWPESWVDIQLLTESIQRYVDKPSLARFQGITARKVMLRERSWAVIVVQLFQILERTSVRTLAPRNYQDLIRLAHYQDRVSEPTTLDYLQLSSRSLARTMFRRFLQRRRN